MRRCVDLLFQSFRLANAYMLVEAPRRCEPYGSECPKDVKVQNITWTTTLGDSYNSAKLFKVAVKGEGMGYA